MLQKAAHHNGCAAFCIFAFFQETEGLYLGGDSRQNPQDQIYEVGLDFFGVFHKTAAVNEELNRSF